MNGKNKSFIVGVAVGVIVYHVYNASRAPKSA